MGKMGKMGSDNEAGRWRLWKGSFGGTDPSRNPGQEGNRRLDQGQVGARSQTLTLLLRLI